ncbi:beta-2-microglobulin-like, partial [Mantella aurantiaca]
SPAEPPQVHVYSRNPYEVGKENQLICHCTDFHPPRISLQLKKDGKELQDCIQSDMTFKDNWAYYITKSVKFTPQEGAVYSCDVTHNEGPIQTFLLDPQL